MLNSESAILEESVSSRRERGRIFFISYLVGAITVAIGFAWTTEPPEFYLSTILYILLFLPYGLVRSLAWLLETLLGMDIKMFTNTYPLPINGGVWLLLLGSYVVFFAVSIAGILTRKQQTFRILYMIFLILLITSMAGCFATVE